jgi:hypothetical protein
MQCRIGGPVPNVFKSKIPPFTDLDKPAWVIEEETKKSKRPSVAKNGTQPITPDMVLRRHICPALKRIGVTKRIGLSQLPSRASHDAAAARCRHQDGSRVVTTCEQSDPSGDLSTGDERRKESCSEPGV